MTMLQVVYISTAKTTGDVGEILATSRRNNARDGITGLLFSDGVRFLQALEGPADKVEATFKRILKDPRHRAVVVLMSQPITERAFGSWAMASRSPGDDNAKLFSEISSYLQRASPSVRATFETFARLDRAA